MIRFVLLGLTTVAIMLAGCSSQPIVGQIEQPMSKAHPSPALAASSDPCSNLATAYSGSPIKPEVVIYSKNTPRTFPIEQTEDALKFYFSEKRPEQAMLLYVHGRALGHTHKGDRDHEPEESKTDVIPEFSSKFNIDATIMFHWPHRKLDEKGFPEDDAKSAGKALACVIQKLNSAEFDANHFPGFRALITHSMGALVLEDAVNNSSEDLHGFNAVIISAAASRAETASTWLSKIASKQRYVLINTQDFVLEEVTDRMHFMPLGKCDSDCFKANQPALGMVYLDITKIAGMPFNKRHNYFVKGKVTDKILIKLLKGEALPKSSQGAYENIRIIKDEDV